MKVNEPIKGMIDEARTDDGTRRLCHQGKSRSIGFRHFGSTPEVKEVVVDEGKERWRLRKRREGLGRREKENLGEREEQVTATRTLPRLSR
jgi:hypothetical protein